MNKTYGGYTLEQLKDIIDFFFKFRSDHHELIELIKSKQDKFFSQGFPNSKWSAFYELSFFEHTSIFLTLSGLTEYLRKISDSEEPHRTFIDETKKLLEEEIISFNPDKEDMPLVLSAMISFGYTLESLYLWGKPLNSLLKDALDGDLVALNKMLQIDRTCMTLPNLGRLIGKHQLLDDKDFFAKLSQSINKKVRDRRDETSELRFALYTLNEKEVLDQLSEDDKYQLFVKGLRLYKDSPEASRSLNTFINRWKKETDTSFSKSLSDTFFNKIHIVLSHVINNSRSLETWRQKDTYHLLLKLGLINKMTFLQKLKGIWKYQMRENKKNL